MASFPTSNRTFTSKVDVTDTIFADHINVLQEEVRAISTSLNGEPVVTNVLTSTYTGTFSTATTAWTNLSSRLLNIEAGLINGVPNAPYVRKVGGDTIEPPSGTVALAVKTTAGTSDLFQAFDSSNVKKFNIDYLGNPKVGNFAVLTTNDVTTGSVTVLGTVTSGVWNATAITPAYGGTGITSYAVGDLIYASGSTTLAKLAAVATGNALISGGVTTAPSWGKIGLTTHISGTLATANGGTNLTSFTSGGAMYATSTSALTTGTLPTASGGTGLTSFNSGGAVYATSTSALTTGTLPVTSGGTGVTTSTGSGALVLGTGPTISGAALTGTPTAPTAADETNTTQVATTAFVIAREQHVTIALSDETTSITTGTAKLTWRAPYAVTLTRVPRLSLATAGTGSATIVDINEAGSSIFSTRPQVDANSKTSVGSTVTPVISDSAIADDAEITFDIDQVGTGAKGLKVTIYFKRA